MAALKESYRQALEQTIKELYEDRIKFDNFDVTPDELVRLFVKPEHRSTVYEARNLYPWSGGHYSHMRTQAPDGLFLSIGQNGPTPVLFPVYDRGSYGRNVMTIQDDVPSNIWEKFNNFVQSQLVIFRQFQLTYQVMSKLNEICASPSQMRFFWPALEVLATHACARDNKETLIKAVMANSKAPVPRITPTLRVACQDTGAVITAQQMMGKPSNSDNSMRPVYAKLDADVTSLSSRNTDFYNAL